MKKKLLLILLFIFSIKTNSQNHKFSTEFNYIVPFDHNFIADNYKGIIDLGIKYRFLNAKAINIGVSLNGGILRTNNKLDNRYIDYKITSYLIQPKLFSKFNLYKFHPFFGIGYTTMLFSSNSDERIVLYGNSSNNDRDKRSGVDFNAGLKIDIYKDFFLQIQYDYIMLNIEGYQLSIKHNTDVNLIKFGLGFNF